MHMSGWVAGTPDSEGGGRFIEPWRRGGGAAAVAAAAGGEEGVVVIVADPPAPAFALASK